MADETPDTPAARIATAIKGCKPHSIPAVRAKDVLAVIGAIPDPKQSALSLVIAKGCASAVQGMAEHLAAEREVHVQAGDLGKLLEDAGVNAQ